MKHVVQVLTDTNIGGAGKYLINYLKYFDRTSFKVSVVLPQSSQLMDYMKEFHDVTFYEAPFMADCSYNKHCVKYLRTLFAQLKPDILHTHACLSARIAGRQAKVPVIIATRHCIEPLPHGLKALAYSVLNNYLCDYYIAVSQAVVTNLLDCGIKPQKIKTVNNGVEPVQVFSTEEISKIRESYGIGSDETVFGIFGRLEPIKGHKYFIKAAREVVKSYPNTRFLIVGSGSLENELKERVVRYNLQNHVIFTGFVTNTAELLNIADVNVNASESEAMSLSVLEAMSLSKASVATRNPGNSELIQNGVNGLLVGYADSASLALAMKQLLLDPLLRQRYGSAAGEKFYTSYTVQKMVSNLETLYKEVSQK
ncbi:MAG: glycosyltransferase family 4 protein [Ruminococcaceae bacterium]|nr:glycosyltransferase family 4 protein [Oscillospiraceae bacterium]